MELRPYDGHQPLEVGRGDHEGHGHGRQLGETERHWLVTRKPYRWPDTRKNRPSPHHFSDMPTIRPSELGLVNLRL